MRTALGTAPRWTAVGVLWGVPLLGPPLRAETAGLGRRLVLGVGP